MKKIILVIMIVGILVITTGCNLVEKLFETDILVFLNLKAPETDIVDEPLAIVEIAPDYLTTDGVIVYEEDEIEDTEIKVEFNGEVLRYDDKYNLGDNGEVKVIMFRGRSLVPLRELTGKLGYDITWEGAGQKQELFIKGAMEKVGEEPVPVLIVGKLNSNEFEIKIGDKKEKVFSETPTLMYEGKIYVPLRFIGETLGLEVIWLGDDNKVDFRSTP